jgi:hypothetical protein
MISRPDAAFPFYILRDKLWNYPTFRRYITTDRFSDATIAPVSQAQASSMLLLPIVGNRNFSLMASVHTDGRTQGLLSRVCGMWSFDDDHRKMDLKISVDLYVSGNPESLQVFFGKIFQ